VSVPIDTGPAAPGPPDPPAHDPGATPPGVADAEETPPGAADHPALRADAQRNRQRIVKAARRVLAEQGLAAPLNEVARRAGVGIATLYRRFPTREALIAAVFAEQMSAYAEAIDKALADTDPWRGFCTFIERACAMQADDHGFTDVLTLTFPTAAAFEATRVAAYRGFVELIARAKAAGRLRADFSPEDLVLLLMANAGVVVATADAAPETWRRLVAYMTQAFVAGHTDPLPSAPTAAALYRAMLRLSLRGGPAAETPD
jgi:AcrR family transcriptional regulator